MPSVETSVRTAADLPVAFSGTIPPTRISPTYRLGLVVVAVAMLLLPVLYLALIAAAGTGVWWHATANTWILDGESKQWRLLAYAAPLVAGVVLLFFMIKPILARPSRREDPLPLDRDAEPRLYALIDEICRQVRAPRPARVEVDCQVNASASFAPGRLSLLRRDLVLRIGLPLAAGLSVRELSGVLAHEFGHFAQGGGMRLTALVRGVNGWFARVVYDRDRWDDALERWSRETDWRIGAVLVLARGAVWVSRRVLLGLMLGGHAISCFMMRQMEYDADSYEVKIAGTETFIRTSARLRELNMGAQMAYGDMRSAIGSGALPANVPAFVAEHSRSLPEALRSQLQDASGERTGLLDTHPCDADRISAAQAVGGGGALVGGEEPARLLFRDFEALCAAATRHHFQHDLALDLEGVRLVQTSAAIAESRSRGERFAALDRFLGDRRSPLRPVHLPLDEVAALDESALAAASQAARDAVTSAGEETAALYAEYERAEEQRQHATAAQELLAAGFEKVSAADFGLPAGTAAAAADALRAAETRQQELNTPLTAFEAAAGRWLACELAARRQGPADAVAAMVHAANALAAVMPALRELRILDFASVLVEHNTPPSHLAAQVAAHAGHLSRRVAARRERVAGALNARACPDGFAASTMTLAERCGVPAGGPFVEPPELFERAVRLHAEIMGRLCASVPGI